MLLSGIVGLPILGTGSACYLERLSEDSFTIGRLLATGGVFDGENVLTTLLSTFEVGTTAFRLRGIQLNCVLGAAN